MHLATRFSHKRGRAVEDGPRSRPGGNSEIGTVKVKVEECFFICFWLFKCHSLHSLTPLRSLLLRLAAFACFDLDVSLSRRPHEICSFRLDSDAIHGTSQPSKT